MKELVQGKKSPYILHMSWTENKKNKKLFFQQMGDWFVKDVCANKKVEEIVSGGSNGEADLSAQCCAIEPIVECHYRDKPSKFDCKKSPPIDNGARSFW